MYQYKFKVNALLGAKFQGKYNTLNWSMQPNIKIVRFLFLYTVAHSSADIRLNDVSFILNKDSETLASVYSRKEKEKVQKEDD